MLEVLAPPVDLTVVSGLGAGLSDDTLLYVLAPPVDLMLVASQVWKRVYQMI
jgi:hypothetical protein